MKIPGTVLICALALLVLGSACSDSGSELRDSLAINTADWEPAAGEASDGATGVLAADDSGCIYLEGSPSRQLVWQVGFDVQLPDQIRDGDNVVLSLGDRVTLVGPVRELQAPLDCISSEAPETSALFISSWIHAGEGVETPGG